MLNDAIRYSSLGCHIVCHNISTYDRTASYSLCLVRNILGEREKVGGTSLLFWNRTVHTFFSYKNYFYKNHQGSDFGCKTKDLLFRTMGKIRITIEATEAQTKSMILI